MRGHEKKFIPRGQGPFGWMHCACGWTTETPLRWKQARIKHKEHVARVKSRETAREKKAPEPPAPPFVETEEVGVKGEQLSTMYFSWCRESMTFTAELSGLPNNAEILSPIGDDPDSRGFHLVSHKTNKSIAFDLDKVEHREGEVMAWWFKPTPEALEKNPDIAGIKVLIVKD